MKYSKFDQDHAKESLLELVKPGDTVYTILRHVSNSGMTRIIQLVVLKHGDNSIYPLYLGYNAGCLLGMPYDRSKEGVKIGGCGMDMGFALVSDLSWKLFNDGYALRQSWL